MSTTVPNRTTIPNRTTLIAGVRAAYKVLDEQRKQDLFEYAQQLLEEQQAGTV